MGSKADKANEYVRYAAHCLEIAKFIPERESRVLQREMAAEWIRLAQGMAEEEISAQPTREEGKRAKAS